MSDTPETDAAQHEGLLRTNLIPLQVVTAEFARRLERGRDEARAVAASMADIAFKRLASLLANTPHSKDAEHDKETQEVIEAIKRCKELKQ
jgi:hypothetical protein